MCNCACGCAGKESGELTRRFLACRHDVLLPPPRSDSLKPLYELAAGPFNIVRRAGRLEERERLLHTLTIVLRSSLTQCISAPFAPVQVESVRPLPVPRRLWEPSGRRRVSRPEGKPII